MSSQIVLPDDFLAVVRSGVLNLVDGIRLSDIRWMTPVQIASFDRPPFLSDRLIPFALTAGRSRYGWWRESESCTCKFVVFSPRDCDEAMIYAPDFSAFLYRSILEDLVDCWGSWLDDDSRVDAIVEMARRNVALASPFLPVAWARTLGEVVSRTPRCSATGSMTWLDSAEARDLILKHFGDFAIDTSIIQHHEQVEMAALGGRRAVGVNVGRIVQRWAMVVGSRRVVLDAPVAVYNLEVAGAHTYFVEDGLGRQTPLWVHNNCAGQLHHAISKRVFRELQDHPNLAGKYALRDSRFVTRAVSLEAHRGYQDWHRLLDDEVVAWLRRNQKATVRKFEKWLVWRYQQPDLRARFPDGL